MFYWFIFINLSARSTQSIVNTRLDLGTHAYTWSLRWRVRHTNSLSEGLQRRPWRGREYQQTDRVVSRPSCLVFQPPTDVRRRGRLPEEPVHALHAGADVGRRRHELAPVLLSEVQQDVGALEDANGRRALPGPSVRRLSPRRGLRLCLRQRQGRNHEETRAQTHVDIRRRRRAKKKKVDRPTDGDRRDGRRRLTSVPVVKTATVGGRYTK